ncbi:MAG: hypothetical protein H6737_21045 [Alphaproteobacteria bacterium]|nr:hypothetical protein [Alphaproteobacteria bacterium]
MLVVLALACTGTPTPPPEAPPPPPQPELSVSTPFVQETDAEGNTRLGTGWLELTCPVGWNPMPRTFTTRYVRCVAPERAGQCVGATEKLQTGTTAATHADAAVKTFESKGGPVDARTDEALDLDGLALQRTDVTRGEDHVLTFTAVQGAWAGVIACSSKVGPYDTLLADFERIGRSMRLREPPQPEPEQPAEPGPSGEAAP